MGMPQMAHAWTREAVLALPDDGNRYELVDGELLASPSPRLAHQIAVSTFGFRIHGYVQAHELGQTIVSPADLDFRSGQLVQPDVFVIPPPITRPDDWTEVGIPILVIEVLSPSTARFDPLGSQTSRRHRSCSIFRPASERS